MIFHENRDYSQTAPGDSINQDPGATWEADSTHVWITYPGQEYKPADGDGYHLEEDGSYYRLSSAMDFFETGRWEQVEGRTLIYKIWELEYSVDPCVEPHTLYIASRVAVPWGSIFTRASP
ncbi:MAG: hypothetical protein OXG13_06660 [Gemmatimonadaceae bacterium]|nr:hypothetical protein [Gemmatimonadaceae bacterium]